MKFVEVGNRTSGTIGSMSDTSDVLSREVGIETGLQLLRMHTHPVLVSAIGEFPINREFPTLYINRKLFSTPQMSQQGNTGSRMVDGKPTYFTTFISTKELPDEDLRLSNEALAKVDPDAFKNASITATAVESVAQLAQENQFAVNTSKVKAAVEA